MLNDDYEIVKSFASIKDAAEYVKLADKSSITNAMRSKRKSRGFYWRHKEGKDIPGEIWKDHPYQNLRCSTEGRIQLPTGVKTFGARMVNGYMTIVFSSPGRKKEYVHRLIAQTFHLNPEDKKVVDHIDFDKRNNRFNNLRWFTQLENCNHRK